MKLAAFLLMLTLAGCSLKGTDSGNPGLEPVSSGSFCGEGSEQDCANSNPAIFLVDIGLCGSLQRCGSPLRGSNCRDRVLETSLLPDHFQTPSYTTSRAFAVGVFEKKISVDRVKLQSCLSALDQKACAQLPANENLQTTLGTLLSANAECAGIFIE